MVDQNHGPLVNSSNAATKKVYVVLNPIAGNASGDDLHAALEKHCDRHGWSHEIYQTTGEENISELTRAACKKGADLIVAAGGDGTVAGVVNGLVGTRVPFGIIPVGTGNGLARALTIPLDIGEAIQLLAERNKIMDLDAMQVDEAYFILNVSAGISSQAMRETEPEQKRRFGILAYAWTISQKLLEHEPRDFILTFDGQTEQVQAIEILVSNGELLNEPPFPMGPPEFYNDNQFDVYVITAQNVQDYARLGWELLTRQDEKREMRTFKVRKSIKIDSVGQPQPVQADGELIGQTPVEIRIVPSAIQVIVPEDLAAENKEKG